MSHAQYPVTDMLKQSSETPVKKQGQTQQAFDCAQPLVLLLGR
jgi:hypothetical protein